jgi:hypothetical protein
MSERFRLHEAMSGRLDEAEDGLIRDCKIVGLVSSNGRQYLPEALKKAIPLYEGASVNIDHVEEEKSLTIGRSLKDKIGRFVGVKYVEGDGLRGDFRYNPAHPMASTVNWWAKNDPGAAGFSQVAYGQKRTVEGVDVIESIDGVESIDLVGKPATTKGFFESETKSLADRVRAASETERKEILAALKEGTSVDLSTLSLAQIKESRRDLFEAIIKESASAQEFEAVKKRLEESEAKTKALEAELLQSKRRARVVELCKESGLPPHGMTSLFIDSVCRLDNDDAVKSAISEQAQAVGGSRPTTSGYDWSDERPQAKEQRLAESFTGRGGDPDDADLDRWVAEMNG